MAVVVPAGPGGWEMPSNFRAHGIRWSSGIASDGSGWPKIPWELFFFLWLGGNKSLLHLLFLLLKSHILGFEPMVSVTSVFFWKAPWQCQAGHTRWEPSPSQASSGHPSAC